MMAELECPAGFSDLETRLRVILPEEYQDRYEVEPVPMRPAGLKYGPDGKVAWDEIWGSFCDLAMAGGPPHRGTLLETGPADDSGEYRRVVDELCRGIAMVSGLTAERSPHPGWVRVSCRSAAMSAWLVRAIVMENVSVAVEGKALDLPAGAGYRLEKEIKNVITAVAKTCHYWLGHASPAQQHAVANLLADRAAGEELIQPALPGRGFLAATHRILSRNLSAAIADKTGMQATNHEYAGWLGLECANWRRATGMMRALVASDVLSRREEAVVFVPVNPVSDPGGEAVVGAVVRAYLYTSGEEVSNEQ